MTIDSIARKALLDLAQFQADPLADATVAAIIGPWDRSRDHGDRASMLAAHTAQWDRLATVSRLFGEWETNGGMKTWRATGPGVTPDMAAALEHYVQSALALPEWADAQKIARAESMFMDYGALSVTLLFCSSLPECYVIPDLAAVLHITGQLEKHTDHRIRSTGAMVFPVMMKGGMTDPAGAGVAQVLKVRLIHATIRNLILRGNPEDVIKAMGTRAAGLFAASDAGRIAAIPGGDRMTGMHQALYAHGWDTAVEGLPCNQEELAYTLLTFNYVFLRSMRKLALSLSREDEEAFMHAWNVAGHMLGIRRELMADTFDEAGALFAEIQARGRGDHSPNPALDPDPRPALGNALMNAMKTVIPMRIAKPFPVLMTRHLCERVTAQELGLNGPMSWLPRLLFTLLMLLTRLVDTVVRVFVPGFSLARFFTRLLGYQFMCKMFMDLTRPLKLPQNVLMGMGSMMDQWAHDPKAPGWMNKLEARCSAKGAWMSRQRT